MKYSMKVISKIIVVLFIINLVPSLLNAQTEPKMVFVKGGTFRMGSSHGDKDEVPVHVVSVKSFYISKYEITVKQYKEYCRATGKKMPPTPKEEWYQEHDRARKWIWKDENPITKVTWYDIIKYCKWLSGKTGKNYELPTEAQWEFAAKGGTKSKHYSFSGSDNINEVAWYDETTYERGPMPVGRLKPNELGIYDMSGNAWEWCNDFYAMYKSSKQNNPKGPSKGIYRSIRGGSWYYVDKMAMSSTRDGPKPDYCNYNYGFRVVINP